MKYGFAIEVCQLSKRHMSKVIGVGGRDFGTASILQDGRVVFNLAGNKCRLVVWVNYAYRVVYTRFIGKATTVLNLQYAT